jgi:hypothetical protein
MYVEKKDLMDLKKKIRRFNTGDPFYNTKKNIIKTIAAGIGMKLFVICIVILFIF